MAQVECSWGRWQNVKVAEHVQCTIRINGCHSEWFDVQTGLKQGCILSPLLFNSFVNDLIHAIRALNCGVPFGDDDSLFVLLYADDIVWLSEDEQQIRGVNIGVSL